MELRDRIFLVAACITTALTPDDDKGGIIIMTPEQQKELQELGKWLDNHQHAIESNEGVVGLAIDMGKRLVSGEIA